MSSEQRVRRLRQLIAQIERMPATPESERMLREIRARVVDVDTGATPSAMRPVEPDPVPVPAPPAKRKTARPAAPPEAAPSVPATAAGLSAEQDREWLALFATNKVLSLDDAAQLPSALESGDRRPWTRGLRG